MAALLAVFSTAASAQKLGDIWGDDPRVNESGAFLADIENCEQTAAYRPLLERKLVDWLHNFDVGDNSIACARSPTVKACRENSKRHSDLWAAMYFNFNKKVTGVGGKPRPKPDCAAFVLRVKAMRILKDEWRPADGLK